MNDIILKVMGICIIVSILVPITVGLKCDSDDINMSTLDSFILITLSKIDDDGYLILNVTNCCIVDIDDITMYVYFSGTGPIFGFNKVDIDTEISVQNLPIGE